MEIFLYLCNIEREMIDRLRQRHFGRPKRTPYPKR